MQRYGAKETKTPSLAGKPSVPITFYFLGVWPRAFYNVELKWHFEKINCPGHPQGFSLPRYLFQRGCVGVGPISDFPVEPPLSGGKGSIAPR
ncbi:MAG TPA: hypothetical protein PLQ00_01925, partial [Thermoguttaceae bacterium]|nr:hypothetical protein [Thermoguttaceae bacterium]